MMDYIGLGRAKMDPYSTLLHVPHHRLKQPLRSCPQPKEQQGYFQAPATYISFDGTSALSA